MRRNKITRGRGIWLAIFLLSIVLAVTVGSASGGSPPPPAADFTVKSLSGRNIKLSELRGHVVLVNFWASWCTPCKKELPYFDRLYAKYKSVGLKVLAVNIDKVKSKAVRMSTTLGLSFPVLLDPAGRVSGLYNIRSMPTTYVVARDGTVRHIHWGFGPDEPSRYEAEIRNLLKE
ncbi:MAG: TlpA family protein disulfide reductase [Nitrospiria bacterium]